MPKPKNPPSPQTESAPLARDEEVRRETLCQLARTLRYCLNAGSSEELMAQIVSKVIAESAEKKTPAEKKILECAVAWANAERELRKIQDAKEQREKSFSGPYSFGPTWPLDPRAGAAVGLLYPPDPEAQRRVVVTCDYTEQMLLDAVLKR